MVGNTYGPGSGTIWLDDVVCRGVEEDLGDCQHNGWGVHNCWHSEDVSISCDDESSRSTSGAAGSSTPQSTAATTTIPSTASTPSTVPSTPAAPDGGIGLSFCF